MEINRFLPTGAVVRHMSHSRLGRQIEPIVPDRPKVTIGRYLAKRLVQAGLKHYFTIPGDFTLAMLDEFLEEDSLVMVGCCNELNAGYAADGYARATKGLACVMVTYMVGGLSAINAVAGSYSDDLPVLCISGGPNIHDAFERHLVHHTIGEHDIYQQSKCFEPIVAKSLVIRHPDDAARMIDEAIHTAIYERKPVYLEVPVNLAVHKIEAPVPITDIRTLPPRPSDPVTLDIAVNEIVKGIENSVKPVLLAGSKIRKTGTEDDFMKFADVLQCAWAYMPDAKGLVPEDHQHCMGRYWGTVSSRHCSEVVESADLVIMVGPILNDYTTVGWSALLSNAKSLIIYPDAVKFGGHYYPNIRMKDVLERVTAKVGARPGSMQTYKRYEEGMGFTADPIFNLADKLSLRFMRHTIEKALTPNTTLVIETGDSWFIGQNLKLPPGCKYNVQMQYGSIGWSVGALLGVALAEGRDRRVVALIGDGSFQLTAQEVSTMIRYDVKATIILLNNFGYTIEVQIHDGPYNDIKNWDYAGLMEVFNNGGK